MSDVCKLVKALIKNKKKIVNVSSMHLRLSVRHDVLQSEPIVVGLMYKCEVIPLRM